MKRCFMAVHYEAREPQKIARLWLSHASAQIEQCSLLPWTSAYAVLHAAVLWECSTKLRETQIPTDARDQTSIVSHGLEISAEAMLRYSGHTFRGLTSLATLYGNLKNPQAAQVSWDHSDSNVSTYISSRSKIYRSDPGTNCCRFCGVSRAG